MSATSIGTLALANRGTVGVLFGQSNANTSGNGTGPSPLVKPAGATLYVGGVLQAAFSAVNHGPEVGLLDELVRVGQRPAATLLRHGVDGAPLANINATHAPALIGHAAAAGVVPRWGVLIQGEAEAAAGATQAGDWNDDLVPVLAKLRQAWGGAFGLVVVRIRTTDAVNYPHFALVGANQDLVGSTWPHVITVRVDTFDNGQPTTLNTDGSGTVHYTSATSVHAGRVAARALMAQGIL
jgi:hypothetical protein